MERERRNEKRIYPVKTMQLIFESRKPIVGRIHNISHCGVSVEYDGQSPPDLDGEITIKMTLDMQSSLMVDGVRCRSVYDIPTLTHDRSFRGANLRLCGLEYTGMSPDHRQNLERLLASAEQHT